MVNLTKVFKTTKHAIDGGEVELELRPYLGMSQLGHECSRYLWYYFNWYFKDKTSPRMTRIWARGHREEPELIKLLESVGVVCSGDQFEMVDCCGHLKGHRDGIATNVIEAPKTPHLLEFKALGDKYFKDLKKKARLELYSQTYYAQTQVYMHYGKLTRCLFMAVNKNDDDLYIERIHYDEAKAEELIRKAETIILSPEPLPRAFPSATFFKCKWCAAKDVCWAEAKPPKNCRTCVKSHPNNQGGWDCHYWPEAPIEIPFEVQLKGCEHYEYEG